MKVWRIFTKLRCNRNPSNLVLISDNDALDFVLNNRAQYFDETPIVFCGINNFKESLIRGQKNITGIIEKPDFSATLNLIQRLHPNREKLYIINDNKTTTALENKKSLKRIENNYQKSLQFNYWEDIRKEDFSDSIQNLSKNSVILLLTFNKDKEGTFLSYRENGELIPVNTDIPVYTTWKFFMNGNVIGGKMISGEEQGLRAGRQAVKILGGTPADSIPVVMQSLSKYIFDYNMLERFSIAESQLPAKKLFINKPRSFYTINKRLINIGMAAMAVAVIIIMVLSNAIIRRRRAEQSLLREQKLLQNRYRFQKLISEVVVLLNSTNDFTRVTDPILQRIIDHYRIGKVSLYHFNENEAIGKVIASNVSNIGRGITELKQQDYNELTRIIDVLKTRNYLVSSDLSELTPGERAFYKKREIKAIAVFPIKIGEKLFGMAGFAQPDIYHWKENEIEEFTTIVRLIANAWERNVQMNKHLKAPPGNTHRPCTWWKNLPGSLLSV
ncbi:MAG: ABC transporter substrate binding protein [Bacteroidales bacterium]|nr:ABC transporter substrate binding protein [Bacteroidales bacterium]